MAMGKARKCQVLGCSRSVEQHGVPVNEFGKLNKPATMLVFGHVAQRPFACCDMCAEQYIAIGLSTRRIE